jgi:hypothetical protein
MASRFITEANVRAVKASARSPFPHMSRQDTAVWSAFLQSNAVTYDSIDYDVAVGGKAAHLVPDDDELAPMWQSLVKKRIDAVVYRVSEVWTVEVKPLANMAALGQALSYAWLWNDEGRTQLKARPVIVADRIDLDVIPIFLAYEVLVFSVAGVKDGAPSIEKVLGRYPR